MNKELSVYVPKQAKKIQTVLLLTDYNRLSKNEVIQSVEEIRISLRSLFKYHIGKENSITPFEVFEKVMGISPLSVDMYKRMYWWSVIKSILSLMRRTNELFVINQGRYLYVLQSPQEAKKYGDGISLHIKRLKSLKKNAGIWVQEQKWREI